MPKNVRTLVITTALAAMTFAAPRLARAQAASEDQNQQNQQNQNDPQLQQQEQDPQPGSADYCPPGTDMEQGAKAPQTAVPPRETYPQQPGAMQMPAQQPTMNQPQMIEKEQAPERGYLLGGYGLGLSVGGGLQDFANPSSRTNTDRGGAWDARVTVFQHFPVGFEGAYIGSAQDIGGAAYGKSVLISNGAEALVRLNFGPKDLQFFAVGGGGWQRYQITNKPSDAPISAISNPHDNVWSIPVGGGLSAHLWKTPFTVEARFMYRPTAKDSRTNGGTLVLTNPGGATGTLDSWTITGRLGYVF